ncbi:MAG: hypothetical protein Q7T03_09650 [Deltaproteobacteria bacterium]|nr:hypothetical protein [Deltaproteobacteria bacterium]
MANTLANLPESTKEKLQKGEITNAQAEAFSRFLTTIEKDFYQHPVIQNNPYTKWFKNGEAKAEYVKDMILQFSVFSNHFLVVQCKRMVNACTEEGEKGARWILANEIGVALDPKTGSCEGGKFATRAAHLNWLRDTAEPLGISRSDLGRWTIGTESTHTFLQGLDETYGSMDENIGAGASFAIETWAAFGIGKGPELESNNFWQELVTGLKAFNEKHRIAKDLKPIHLGFFQYHFQIESGHGANVFHELEETFFAEGFNEKKYLEGGRKALESIYTFWTGLDATRKKL